LTPGRAASREATYGLLDQLEAVRDAFDRKPVPWRRVSAGTARLLLSLEAADFLFERDELSPVFWCPSAERLEWLPLETGPWIAGCLDGFAGTTLFSATLRPFESLVRAIGFPAGQPEFVGIAPVPNDRFRIAIDARAETTLRRRREGYAATAARVRSFAEAADGCVAVFFPSYEYAEAIRTYLEAEAPHLRVTLQPRDLDAEERDHFARFAPLGNDILLLMLGGSFAEAIDAFGGVIRGAVIVGPALPELSALTRLRMDAYPDRETGFHEVCRVPGMRRVNQAIGRFVRQADHRADILLYDKRFLEPEYRSLLRADLPDPTIIRTPSDWQTWLHPPS
jgi:Rad3-related DNA helicase